MDIESKAAVNEISKVERFVEKPDKATAEQFLGAGNFLWNSGMFLIDAQTYLSELAQYAPAILHACKAACKQSMQDLDFTRLSKTEFAACPGGSIDYKVMEKSNSVYVLPYESEWSDPVPGMLLRINSTPTRTEMS